jgi:hypothetical protein
MFFGMAWALLYGLHGVLHRLFGAPLNRKPSGGYMSNMLNRKAWLPVAVTFAALFAAAPSNLFADEFIAGSEPSQRPAGAPVLNTFTKNADWYRTALTGVEPPYPPSLRFLEDQGAWHTPFNRSGLTGPYDIRNWHDTASGGAGRSVPVR